MHFENASDVYANIENIENLTNDSNKKYLQRLAADKYDGPYAIEWFGLGSRTMSDCIKNAVEGNQLLYNRLQQMMSQINSKIDIYDNVNSVTITKRKKVRREFGNELDIHRVYQGKLDTAWTNTERIEVDQEHHLITILIDIGGNCNIDAMQALWTAAACMKYIEVLEKAGKQIQVIVGGVATNAAGKYDMSISMVVKKYDEQLNVERLSAMCHIGYYRSAGFVAKLSSSQTCNKGLGFSTNFSLDLHTFKLPIPLHDEYKQGKTKIVLFKKALDFSSAINAIEDARKKLIENAQK